MNVDISQQLLKSEVDDYVKLPLLYRPSCRITVYGEQTANEPQLHHPIELNGIECKTKKIFINLCMTTHNLSGNTLKLYGTITLY